MHASSWAAIAARHAWLDRRVAWWALYDVASSSRIAIVPLLFPLLFATVLEGEPRADARFALLAYARGNRAPWLIVATFALVMASTNALCRLL